ncbi:hypothetical protein MKX01_006151 [Papaver californicum]|nr:hypothetical protein MKX01_006151 [Papaver californicum]
MTKVTSAMLVGKPNSHVRSVSLPTKSHPEFLKLEEELNKIKAWEASTKAAVPSTSTFTANTIQVELAGLAKVYNSFEEVLSLALTKQALVSCRQNKGLVDKILDGTLGALDIFRTIKDDLPSMKKQVQDLQSALRRRRSSDGEFLSMENTVDAYYCFRKKMEKDLTSKCLPVLKKTGKQYCSSTLNLEQEHLSMMVKLFNKIRVITVSILQHLLSFMTTSKPVQSRNAKWALVSKLIYKQGRLACKGHDEANMSEVELVDVALLDTISVGKVSSKEITNEKLQAAKKWLEKLDNGIDDIEAISEVTFRRMIQTRVSLLNMFAN